MKHKDWTTERERGVFIFLLSIFIQWREERDIPYDIIYTHLGNAGEHGAKHQVQKNHIL